MMKFNAPRRVLLAVTVLILLTAAAASAQTTILRANVPFPFYAADKAMPSGDYIVTVDSAANRVKLLNEDNATAVMFLVGARSLKNTEMQNSALVFHRYGNTSFLRQVWRAGQKQRFDWPASRLEKEVHKNNTTLEVAYVHPVTK
jgi:hypothetical protein